jgi:hypothetical protein
MEGAGVWYLQLGKITEKFSQCRKKISPKSDRSGTVGILTEAVEVKQIT